MDNELVLIAGAGLVIMIAASVFSRRTGVAAPLLLVLLGIGTSYLPGTPQIDVDPEVILAGVLPPLLYASAIKLPVIDVRRNLGMITWLSVVLVVISALLIGVLVHAVFPSIDLPLAFALGAVVSPTDAVAATAIGRRLGLPPRVMTVLEGESLVNDASALVLLRSALLIVTATGQFHLSTTVLSFLWAVIGALAVGAVVGWLTVLLRQWLDDPVLNTTISFAVPFIAFEPAEQLHASGVLAVVVAGVASGTLGSRRFTGRDRQTQSTTWGSASFVLESAVFIAMGYELPQVIDAARSETSVGQMTALVVLVVGLLVAVRMLGLGAAYVAASAARERQAGRQRQRLDQFGERLDNFEPQDKRGESRLQWARRRLARGEADYAFEKREPITRKGLLVLGWTGMRGVVTVAAAQTIPVGTPHRATVVLCAFLVALVTLVLFGLTLPPLIRAMDFAERNRTDERDDMFALVRQVGADASDTLGPLESQKIDGEPIDPDLVVQLKEHVLPRLLGAIQTRPPSKPGLAEQSRIIQRRYLDAMRDELVRERSIGAYSSHTFRRVESLLDSLEQRLN